MQRYKNKIIQRNKSPFFAKIQRNNLLIFAKIQRNNLLFPLLARACSSCLL